MGFLNQIKIGPKIGGGFGLVLAALVVLAVSGDIALSSIEKMFLEYRGLARLTNEVGQVESNLLGARLGVKTFLQTGSPEAVQEVKDRGKAAYDMAEHAEGLASTTESKEILHHIQEEFQQYLDAFDLVVQEQDFRDSSVSQLDALGPQMEQKLTEVMKSANEDGDISAAFNAGQAMRHMLLGRLYVTKFLVDNTDASRERVLAELKAFDTEMQTLLAQLEDPTRRALSEEVLELEKQYSAEFQSAFLAIKGRNGYVESTLDKVGPYIANEIEELKLSTKSRQDTLGPAAIDEIESTILMLTLISVGAVAFGLLASLLISRGISHPIGEMTEAMNALAEKDLSVAIPAQDHKDEVGMMAKSMQVFKDNMVRAEQLAETQKQEQMERAARAQRIEALNQDFDQGVSSVLHTVSAAATELQGTSESMTSIAADTNDRATAVAAAAEDAASNVQTVAAAAEELASSISEIGRQVQHSSDITQSAADRAQSTHQAVEGLAQSADKIGEVVNLITDIAEQTNLLALNATIEAARAGDAGKGFAVVASEVKNLANQTARATDEISGQINHVQAETHSAVTSIKAIVKVIEEINEVSTSISSAVEEQNAATAEIARNVQEASSGTQEVTSNIGGVSQAAGEAGSAANQVHTATNQLSTESDHLRDLVAKFLSDVRAA